MKPPVESQVEPWNQSGDFSALCETGDLVLALQNSAAPAGRSSEELPCLGKRVPGCSWFTFLHFDGIVIPMEKQNCSECTPCLFFCLFVSCHLNLVKLRPCSWAGAHRARLLRFGVEVLLLLLVIGQVSCLVVLHSVEGSGSREIADCED